MTVDVKSYLRAHSRVRCSPCGSSEIMQHRSSVETEPVTSTVDHADIRGLVTTLLISVGCLPRSRHEGLSQPHNVHEGCTLTGAAPPPRIDVAPISCRVMPSSLRRRGLRLRDRPHEPRQLSRDGRGNRVRVLAAEGQLLVPPAQAHLRPPRDVADLFGELLLPSLDLL